MTINPRKETRICIVCGKPFEAWSSRDRIVCSDACENRRKYKSHKTVHMKFCVSCGKEFSTNHLNKIVCTKCLAHKADKKTKEKLKEQTRLYPPKKVCPVCGIVFVDQSRFRGKKNCSRKCTKKANLDSHNYCGQRRAVILSAQHTPYSRGEVFERDSYTCYLCGLPLDMSAQYPSNFYPTVDHVVPLTKGGEDNLSNVRAAHFICNVRKSNRL